MKNWFFRKNRKKNFLDYKILKIEKSKIENLINLKNQKLKKWKIENRKLEIIKLEKNKIIFLKYLNE